MATPAAEPNAAPSKRRKIGMALRLLIYIPLLGFFGWRAGQRYFAGREAADANFRASVQQWLQHPPRAIMMPNGEAMPVLELTEDEAVEMGLLPEGGREALPGSVPEPAPTE